jgi:hypothetical protein
MRPAPAARSMPWCIAGAEVFMPSDLQAQAGAVPAADPGARPGAHPGAHPGAMSKPWRESVAEVVKAIPFVGPPLATAIKNGSWGVVLLLLWAVWTFFIYPLLVPALAAGWINHGVLFGARSFYTEPVRQAFGVQEFAEGMAQESNKRLDYVQVIEYDADASQPQTYLLSVMPNQRVVYRVEQAHVYSEDKRCPVPPEVAAWNASLFTMSVEGASLGDIRNGSHETRSLTAVQWKAIVDKAGSDVDRLAIQIQPVQALAAKRCGKIKVQMRILFKVYKDLVGSPA